MKILKSLHIWLLAIPFIIWMFCFRSFLSGQMGIVADGVSYFDHIGFFTDHLARGQYPLWDHFWYDGAPYHFFLRRIGEFNPFYLIIVVLKICGVGHPAAYLTFLTVYYALAMAGFYALVKYVLKNEYAAYMAYLLLLFSSWGTQLFYNYIILLFVPLVWFFYFLIRFIHEQRKYQWLGLCFCLGLILTTYIPFYFLTIFSLFILAMFAFYLKESIAFIEQLFGFFNKNRVVTLVSVVFLLASVLPGYVLYKESKAGEFVMPSRGAGADVPSAVAVGIAKVASGDFINNSAFDKYFGGLDRIMLGDFFIPYVFLLFLFLSCFAKINRLILSTFLIMAILLLITITESSFLHEWLFKHVFFFKFIRNIYYFFWLAILPLGVFWVAACLTSLCEQNSLLNKFITEKWISFKHPHLLLCVLIIPQALFVYADLTKNMRPDSYPLVHQKPNYEGRKFESFSNPETTVSTSEDGVKVIQDDLYYSNHWYADVYHYIDRGVLSNYSQKPLRLYDNVRLIDHVNAAFWKELELTMANERNSAFIVSSQQPKPSSTQSNQDKAIIIPPHDPRLTWVKFGPNDIYLKSNLSESKFCVINNNFDSHWHLTINGKIAQLFRANYAYQGFWIPAGESQIHLQFESKSVLAWHWGMLIGFSLFLTAVIIFWRRSR